MIKKIAIVAGISMVLLASACKTTNLKITHSHISSPSFGGGRGEENTTHK